MFTYGKLASVAPSFMGVLAEFSFGCHFHFKFIWNNCKEETNLCGLPGMPAYGKLASVAPSGEFCQRCHNFPLSILNIRQVLTLLTIFKIRPPNLIFKSSASLKLSKGLNTCQFKWWTLLKTFGTNKSWLWAVSNWNWVAFLLL